MGIEVEDRIDGKLSRADLNPRYGDHVLGYGMLEVPKKCNIMFTAWVRDGKPTSCRRIRIYIDDKIHDSDDIRRFSIHEPERPMTPEQWWTHCVREFEKIRDMLPTITPDRDEITYSVTEVNGTCEEWMAKLSAEPWASVRYERAPPPTAN